MEDVAVTAVSVHAIISGDGFGSVSDGDDDAIGTTGLATAAIT